MAETTSPQPHPYAFLAGNYRDASAWTAEYMRLHGDKLPDEGNIIGWFANAIEAQHLSNAEHPDDLAVDRFAAVMKAKMKHAREVKGRSGWDDPAQISIDKLVDMMVDHVAKGDYVDLGNFAMMIWNREQA